MATLAISTDGPNNSSGGAVFAMPAVPLQARLWQLKNAGMDPAWNVAVRFRLSGPLDHDRLEQALRLLVGRHEALRTTLGWNGSAVVQRIASWAVLPVEWCDLRSVPASAQPQEIARLSTEHARQPFSLDQAPLFRVRVLRVADEEYILLWNAHHAICDGWSIGLLARDWMQCYGELSAGRGPQASNALDFGDYAVWLESERNTPDYEAHRNYWKRQLRVWKKAALPEHWRNPEPSRTDAAIQSVLLPRNLTDRIAAVAQRHGATFFHAVLAAFSVWMRTQQSSPFVAIGTPVSGRDQTELENVIGTFVNYVPLLFRVEEEKTFANFLHAVRDSAAEALDHAEFRLEDMLALQNGGTDEQSLFSVAFICQQDFVRPVASAGMSLSALPSVSAGALRPLTVFLVEREDGWRLSCEVDNKNVSLAVGESMLREFQQILEAVAAHAGETISLLAMRAGRALPQPMPGSNDALNPLPADSHPAVPANGNRTRVPATEFQKRLWLLEAVNPDDSGPQLRIRLEMRGPLDVERLHAALRDLAQRHETLRTTFEEQDGQLWQVIHPQASLDFQVLEAGVPETQASSGLGEDVARLSLANGPLYRTRLVRLGENHYRLEIALSHGIADGWAAGLFLQQLQELYEAQLRGTRKEVELAAFQFSDYAEAEQALLSGPEKDRRLQWWKNYLAGVWKPLALPRDLQKTVAPGHGSSAGLERELLDSDTIEAVKKFARDRHTTLFAVFGAVFQALLMRYSGQNDILFTTPHANRSEETESILGRLADPICLTGHADASMDFRTLLEQFSRQSLDAMENALPLGVVMPLVEMKGSETYHPLNQVVFFYQRAFVHKMEWKDIHVQPLPDIPAATGSEWQLGVVEREDSIALEFVYDASLYSQSAMRHVVRDFTRALERAVVAPEKSLAEIVKIGKAANASISGSSTAAFIDQGKASVLPPATENHVADATHSAASIEQEIQQIWQQLFKVESLNTDANFFDLGGHSLMLAMLQIALKKKFNVQLTAADVFRNPTIAALAGWVEKTRMAARQANSGEKAWMQNSRIVPIQPAGEGRPLFVISQSMIFRTLASELGATQPVYAVQMLEQDEASLGSMSYDDLMNFYVDLVRQVQPAGPYRIAGWCVSGWIAYGVARQLEQLGEKVEMLLAVDACAPEYWQRMSWARRKFLRVVYNLQRSRWMSKQTKPMEVEGKQLTGIALVLGKLQARFHRVEPTPAEVEEQRRNSILQNISGKAADKGPLQGNILVFCSEQEPLGPFLDPDMGWSALLGRPVAVGVLPGDHRQIFELPGARIMAQSARKLLGIDVAGLHPPSSKKINAASVPSPARTPMVEA